MEAKIVNFIESVCTSFIGGHRDLLAWCDSKTVDVWELEYVFSSDEHKNEIRQYLSWALVHSKEPDDVQCGITMLQDSLLSTSNPSEKKKVMYILAVGYYRSGEYSKSKDLVDACLEISPRCWTTASLKKLLEYSVKKDEVKGKVFAVSSMACIVARVLACTTKSSYPTLGIEAITWKDLTEDRVKVVAASLPSPGNTLQMKEQLYMLAHRYYIRRDYSRSKHLIDCCLEIAPEWRPAITLQKSIGFYFKKAKVIGGVVRIVGAAAVFVVSFVGGCNS